MLNVVKARSLAVAVLMLGASSVAQAHCQIPCGIYDDHARVKAVLEDVATTEKAVNVMTDLVGKTDIQSQNQMVRWVYNKEKHAQNVIDTISDYFLTQRVKSSQEDYEARLVKHHAVIVAAMKVKQNANVETVEALHDAVVALAPYYPEHKH